MSFVQKLWAQIDYLGTISISLSLYFPVSNWLEIWVVFFLERKNKGINFL